MSHQSNVELSVVVPVFNEATGIAIFHQNLHEALESTELKSYEIIYCDDGSSDESVQTLHSIADRDKFVKIVALTRNFGKEYALTAGIESSIGDAVLSLDGDGQHPVNLIDQFVKKWRAGSRLVIGVRDTGHGAALGRRISSKAFHWLFNHMSSQTLLLGSTDYRLIDQSVRLEFLKLKENNRITRGLIDWLGFQPDYIYFQANDNDSGSDSFSLSSQLALASSSFTSLAVKPLYIFGYLGIFIAASSFILGMIVLIEQLLLGDPLLWNFTGTAMLAILIIFLVGIILMSQGVLSLYISSILNQSKDRPLYVVDHKNSVGIDRVDNK